MSTALGDGAAPRRARVAGQQLCAECCELGGGTCVAGPARVVRARCRSAGPRARSARPVPSRRGPQGGDLLLKIPAKSIATASSRVAGPNRLSARPSGRWGSPCRELAIGDRSDITTSDECSRWTVAQSHREPHYSDLSGTRGAIEGIPPSLRVCRMTYMFAS